MGLNEPMVTGTHQNNGVVTAFTQRLRGAVGIVADAGLVNKRITYDPLLRRESEEHPRDAARKERCDSLRPLDRGAFGEQTASRRRIGPQK